MRRTSLLVICLLALCAHGADATVIFDRPAADPFTAGTFFSDVSRPREAATPFALAGAANVHAISWRGGYFDPTGFRKRGQLGADPRIVETRRGRMGLDDLAVAVLEHQRARAMEDAGRAAEDGRSVAAGLHAVAGRGEGNNPRVRAVPFFLRS